MSRFFVHNCFHSLHVLTVWVCNFWQKEIGAKAARKMLVKLLQEVAILGCLVSIPRTWLFSQEVHDVSGEFVAALVVLLHLLLVDGADLRQLGLVVGVLDGGAAVLHWARGSGFVRAWNPDGTTETMLDPRSPTSFQASHLFRFQGPRAQTLWLK